MVRWVCRFVALQVTHHRVIVAVSELSGLLKHVQIRGSCFGPANALGTAQAAPYDVAEAPTTVRT
jgi:hypothetical protein